MLHLKTVIKEAFDLQLYQGTSSQSEVGPRALSCGCPLLLGWVKCRDQILLYTVKINNKINKVPLILTYYSLCVWWTQFQSLKSILRHQVKIGAVSWQDHS